MFEVLMFLFENYMDGTVVLKADNGDIVIELERIGFRRNEIDRALDWLDGLIETQTAVMRSPGVSKQSIRCFSPEECDRMSVEARGFLMYLEQVNILDPLTREVVIDRLMALDMHEIDLPRVRWVTLMALFNQPEKKAALSLLQDMILADAFDVLH